MSGQVIGSIIGTVLGAPLGPIGMAIGSTVGGMIGSTFDTLPTQYGPRLEDLRPQTSEYGKPIPLVYGTAGMGGNVIWASDYVEVETETEQGGKGGPSQTSVTYSYYGNFAVAFAEGPNTIGRMWAGPSKRLIYDGMLLEGGGTVRIYEGTEDQLPDPLIESYEGVGNVPAHRGVTYVVFEMFPLAEDGNAIPFITAEVGAKAGAYGKEPTPVGPAIYTETIDNAQSVVDPATGWIWQVSNGLFETEFSVRVISDKAQEVVADFTIDTSGMFSSMAIRGIAASPSEGAVYVLLQPDIAITRRAAVARFAAGAAAADGTASVMPSGGEVVLYGDATDDEPMDARAIFATSSELWIAYAFTNAAPAYYGVYQIGGNPQEFVEVHPEALIGIPFQMLGDDHYIGVVGAGGPGGTKLSVLNATGRSVLHTQVVPTGISGKVFDYDPKREVFIAYGASRKWYVINAATGAMTTHQIDLSVVQSNPAASGVLVAVAYSSKTDRYLLGATSDGVGAATTLYVINPDSGAVEGVYTFEPGAFMQNPLLDPIGNTGAPYVLSYDQDTVKRLSLGGLPVAMPMNLGAIVADLSLRAGLTAGQIDVSALTDMVDGYAIARQTTVRSAIDALRPAYYFDAVESGGKVKFVKRGGSAVTAIDDNDLDAHQADGQPGDPLLTTRQMEVELPKTVSVNYLLAATDYEKATQTYSRQIGSSEEETTLDLPLVLTDTKGQEIAQVNAHAAWVQRIKYGPFTLPRKYSGLEPTDIITVRGYEMMLEKVTASPGGILTCEAVATDSSHYAPHVVVTETVPAEKLVYVPGETVLELM